MGHKKEYTQKIKSTAQDLGFLSCGISKAEFLEEEAPRLEQWLKEGRHGQMAYMENHFDKRLDPRLLVPGARSVVSLLFNYYPEKQQASEAPKFSKYAYGQDYHEVIKDKLKKFFQSIQDQIGEVNGRVFVDSAPVMDKAWAARSGLGWIGKNTNLIAQKVGSFFFIAELILDLELEYDTPATDHCGSCTACIDACPTQALTPYQIDAGKCISYLTIELKDQIPDEFQGKMDGWAFGCDVCQDVCPWNRFSKPHREPLFQPQPQLLQYRQKDWDELTEATFELIFKNSAVKRTRYKGLKRNLAFINR
ncbi:MAG: tRNA epoxyqueuosine(34) reductase QueG [Flavobacteriia bacterium]|nr:tRNA epoxyqueuosine(34) reductase QueG [Flavobacteriia bacterium]